MATQKKVIPSLHWAVFEKGNMICSFTIQLTRREAIEVFLNGSTCTWKEAKKSGFTCEKIIISKFENNPK